MISPDTCGRTSEALLRQLLSSTCAIDPGQQQQQILGSSPMPLAPTRPADEEPQPTSWRRSKDLQPPKTSQDLGTTAPADRSSSTRAFACHRRTHATPPPTTAPCPDFLQKLQTQSAPNQPSARGSQPFDPNRLQGHKQQGPEARGLLVPVLCSYPPGQAHAGRCALTREHEFTLQQQHRATRMSKLGSEAQLRATGTHPCRRWEPRGRDRRHDRHRGRHPVRRHPVRRHARGGRPCAAGGLPWGPPS